MFLLREGRGLARPKLGVSNPIPGLRMVRAPTHLEPLLFYQYISSEGIRKQNCGCFGAIFLVYTLLCLLHFMNMHVLLVLLCVTSPQNTEIVL